MDPVRRAWSLEELIASLPELHNSDRLLLRCKHTCQGRGRYVKEILGTRHVGEVALQVVPADTLSVSFGHEWPGDLNREETADLDRSLLQGIVGSLAHLSALASWGCGIQTTAAVGTTAVAVKLAAVMAVRDMLSKADWTPGSPREPEAA